MREKLPESGGRAFRKAMPKCPREGHREHDAEGALEGGDSEIRCASLVPQARQTKRRRNTVKGENSISGKKRLPSQSREGGREERVRAPVQKKKMAPAPYLPNRFIDRKKNLLKEIREKMISQERFLPGGSLQLGKNSRASKTSKGVKTRGRMCRNWTGSLSRRGKVKPNIEKKRWR